MTDDGWSGDDECAVADAGPLIESLTRTLGCDVQTGEDVPVSTARLARVRAIRRLAELEANTPGADAPSYERESYEHRRASVFAGVAADMLEAVLATDVVADAETGKLLVAKEIAEEIHTEHSRDAYYARVHGEQQRGGESEMNG